MSRFLGSTLVGLVTLAAVTLSGTPTARATPVHSPPKVVYLTFDDGPSQRYTPKLLDILHSQHIHATFFVVGYRCEEFPALVRRIQQEGHEIGNHGFAHFNPKKRALEEVVLDIRKTDTIVERACGTKPLYYRPPYGAIDPSEIECVHRLGHRIALWTVDSMDWKAKSANAIVHQVEEHVHPGSIVLFHDGISSSRYTIEAMPKIIRDFKRDGYVFEPLPLSDSHRIDAFMSKTNHQTISPRDGDDVERHDGPSSSISRVCRERSD
ncbi:polysaccharide deacetylase family protein [Alicyclobacillus vulcanalis]|uniref:Peptidoglycan/xylan/chitin deacetylase, PgdA/CDA1 family n=1 Tax=Alicyclobacillus vulcanalis TaxID=252246 RepID=A0A1N7MXZ7_9BACL|nr:polysaccharide deacetylase family protein [Alicyclobacillus vulcanalis]SIS90987.1 Peptidoglycan/xylan/chitin deacetylase, PgdA/CDA1 family [Alicyclobacillus vulcanalis]